MFNLKSKVKKKFEIREVSNSQHMLPQSEADQNVSITPSRLQKAELRREHLFPQRKELDNVYGKLV